MILGSSFGKVTSCWLSNWVRVSDGEEKIFFFNKSRSVWDQSSILSSEYQCLPPRG